MESVKSVIRRELKELTKRKKEYEKRLEELPRGALAKKRIRNNEYYYLVSRENGKVKLTYKGKLEDAEVARYDEAKRKRAEYRKKLSALAKEMVALQALLERKMASEAETPANPVKRRAAARAAQATPLPLFEMDVDN